MPPLDGVPAALSPAPSNASQPPAAPPAVRRKHHYGVLGALPFIFSHLAVFAAIWTGVTWQALALCFALLFIRTFAITGFYHRYFAHRTFKTGRIAQFFFAFLAQTSAQRGALWWAAHHRVHHKESDQPGDVHSPIQDGIFYSHVGWIFADGLDETRWDKIRDFARYPELRFLNRMWLLPPIVLAVGCWLWLGWPGLVVGFFWSTVLLWHNTFLVNSFTHIVGKRRFETSDYSKNHWLIALSTLGEGWHNNHHHYQSSTRQGFYWWEIDITYYLLKAMSWLRIVWDIREPPEHVLAEGRERDRAAKTARAHRKAPARDAAPAGVASTP